MTAGCAHSPTPLVDRSDEVGTSLGKRPSQHRHHRSRRPRKDHPGRPHAPPGRHLPRQRGRGRTSPGLQRPGARKGHHDPRQGHLGDLPGGAHQHPRHPRSRRLWWRGRARAAHGGRRGPPLRCGGRAASADALRPRQGDGPGPAGDRGHQQDRPRRRTAPRGPRRGPLPAHRPRRRRRSARLPGDLRHRQGGEGDDRPLRAREPIFAPSSTPSSPISPRPARRKASASACSSTTSTTTTSSAGS